MGGGTLLSRCLATYYPAFRNNLTGSICSTSLPLLHLPATTGLQEVPSLPLDRCGNRGTEHITLCNTALSHLSRALYRHHGPRLWGLLAALARWPLVPWRCHPNLWAQLDGCKPGTCCWSQLSRNGEPCLPPLTASQADTGDGGHPEVGGAGVEDHGEVLRRGADGDGPIVLHLRGNRAKSCF